MGKSGRSSNEILFRSLLEKLSACCRLFQKLLLVPHRKKANLWTYMSYFKKQDACAPHGRKNINLNPWTNQLKQGMKLKKKIPSSLYIFGFLPSLSPECTEWLSNPELVIPVLKHLDYFCILAEAMRVSNLNTTNSLACTQHVILWMQIFGVKKMTTRYWSFGHARRRCRVFGNFFY